jgi:hypothetical protein
MGDPVAIAVAVIAEDGFAAITAIEDIGPRIRNSRFAPRKRRFATPVDPFPTEPLATARRYA